MSSLTPDLFDSLPSAARHAAGLALVPAATHGGTRRAARELWLCLLLPRLPLDALGAETTPGPAGVVEGEGARQYLLAVNDAAVRHGIAAGQGVNTALALWPGLTLFERRPAAETALLDRLARWVTQFTPRVSLEPPQAVLAEVRGSLGLFGGAAGLCQRVRQELQQRGLGTTVTLAPTPRASLWLARAGLALQVESVDELPALAARLPLACLGWPPAVTRMLVTLGVRSLADIIRLPRAGLARRFGPALLDELDQGFGRRPQPRQRAVMPERFDDSLELPAESDSLALIDTALQRLLDRLQAFLRARAAGVCGLVVEFGHHDQAATRCRLGLAQPSGGGGYLASLLRERLGRLSLPAAVCSLRLRSTVVVPLELRSQALPGGEDEDTDPETAPRLLERLRARLGSSAVFSLCPVAEHRPEFAWRRIEPVPARPGRKTIASAPHVQQVASAVTAGGGGAWVSRPLWMLLAPERLAEHDGMPWHGRDPLRLAGGPERIESGWWDGRDVRRDYFVAVESGGARLWIYRERDGRRDWWLHGMFG